MRKDDGSSGLFSQRGEATLEVRWKVSWYLREAPPAPKAHRGRGRRPTTLGHGGS